MFVSELLAAACTLMRVCGASNRNWIEPTVGTNTPTRVSSMFNQQQTFTKPHGTLCWGRGGKRRNTPIAQTYPYLLDELAKGSFHNGLPHTIRKYTHTGLQKYLVQRACMYTHSQLPSQGGCSNTATLSEPTCHVKVINGEWKTTFITWQNVFTHTHVIFLTTYFQGVNFDATFFLFDRNVPRLSFWI